MAAEVTVATGFPRTNVTGSLREYVYKVSTGSTTDYLTTPLRVVKEVTVTASSASVTPSCTVAAVSASDKRQRVTLGLGANDSAMYIKVAGW
jgi:hypothetical protein